MGSSVTVQVPDRSWTVAEFCLDDECSPPGRDVQPEVMVADAPAEYRYHLVVVDPAGAELAFDGVLATTEYRVNGDGCDPVTANAVVVVRSDGTVAVEPLEADRS